MDQSLLADIGNIYADDILFLAELHPKTPVQDRDREARERLREAALTGLEIAIVAEGGWDGVETRLPQTFLLPRRSECATCPRYGGAVAKIKGLA